MKIEAILALEAQSQGEIHLVRDRLFWQAWEQSAFLFVKQVRPYKVHHRRYQKVGQDMVWLGFPRTALANLEADLAEAGITLEWDGEDHIVLRGLAVQDGFAAWKQGVIGQLSAAVPLALVGAIHEPSQREQPQQDSLQQKATSQQESTEDRWLPLYRHAYDLALHIFRACAKVGKEYKYSLAEHLRKAMTEMVESLHLLVTHLATGQQVIGPCLQTAQKVRIHLRLLKDLQQVSLKQ